MDVGEVKIGQIMSQFHEKLFIVRTVSAIGQSLTDNLKGVLSIKI